jgi:hypothetical protein
MAIPYLRRGQEHRCNDRYNSHNLSSSRSKTSYSTIYIMVLYDVTLWWEVR